MDYKQFIQLAQKNKPFERIQLEGSQTIGHLKTDKGNNSGFRTRKLGRERLGVDYARQYQLEDEEYERQMQYTHAGQMYTVDDLTSVATDCFNMEPLSEQLTYVYESYSFETKQDSDLQISEYKELIIEHIDQNLVTIIKGQTGCGKTTQVPQFILDSCRDNNIHCNIIVTQPRRIAAISVAKRVCDERKWELGTLVGYQIALEKQCSKDTRLLYCTAGVLLQELVAKQNLSTYTHIIIDEVHERDNETDFLLIVLKMLLRVNGNRTKVILMSATINTDKFAEYFSKTVRNEKIEPPVIELTRETKFPVSCYYLDSLIDRVPLKAPNVLYNEPTITKEAYEFAIMLVEVFHKIDIQEHKRVPFLGSVLIFLPGLQEIETLYEMLSKRKAIEKNPEEEWMICPLHSSVTFDEQIKVFKLPPRRTRKIILATNIAESSITVPDVKYVIDFCLMRMQVQECDSSYSSLQLSWISKNQGQQRAGRVGRVMPGRVYRLVPEAIYEDFEEECIPELVRCPLDSLVLKAKQLKMGPPVAILGRAMDPPDLSNIYRTVLNLKEMGALCLTVDGEYKEDDGDLTFIGVIMASLPLDTHLSKLIILGHMFSCLKECVIMASAMAVKSIFSTPFKQQLAAYSSKLSWADSSFSDPVAFLNVYWLWRHKTTMGMFKRTGAISEHEWAKKYFVQVKSLKEIARLENEILERLKRLNIEVGREEIQNDLYTEKDKALILKLVLAGAAYPNFFSRSTPDEKEAVKILGGRDPFSTIYLTNFPPNQPGPLYIQSIKKHFNHCGSGINVSFDGSFKVYLQFESSHTSIDGAIKDHITGKIMLAIYRAIKLRQLGIPIIIPVLPHAEAQERAKQIFGDNLNTNVFCWEKKKEKVVQQVVLPGLSVSVIPVIITHLDNPHLFWVHLSADQYKKRHLWLNSQMSRPGFMVPIKRENVTHGKVCIAPYTEDGDKSYYRVKIIWVNETDPISAQVLYIDYGNKEVVSINDLYDFSKEGKKLGLEDEPGLAVKCSLAEIEPSVALNPKGNWSREAIVTFMKYFSDSKGIAKIYSTVNDTMIIYLYKNKANNDEEENWSDLVPENSFNHYLIQKGFAEVAEEPYLSRENYTLRQLAQKSPEMKSPYPTLYPNKDLFTGIAFQSPAEHECKTKIKLNGPKSPLEMNLKCLTRKCQGMDVQIEWNSVNSVLLDLFPMDMHDRLIIASSVSQKNSSDRLILRNTTLMPNIHGLLALLIMIFAPKTELRTDPDRRAYTGALCGLGFNEETSEAYNPENDIEVTFDTKFDLMDLENINKLRFWMNYIVRGDSNVEENDISSVQVLQAQKKIKEYILSLVGKKRPSKPQEIFEKSFEWGLAPEEYLLNPQQGNIKSIYPLIWAIELKEGVVLSKIAAMQAHLKQLRLYSEGIEMLKGETKCELCQIVIKNVPHLKLHLHTTLHKTNFANFATSS
ncbi:probable ATP-dependent RNA helicase spindle-E [Cimex lectularius]|uniref:Probable ATP-dependent RNA helicase spindle-E n=1 Tax=Cimex lectularius TaxID=79782 RepID=A0A8I6SKD9_CIMLE|nr:probable ATP-dependent RNA helicase spindle-E [Cimex lectularius]XP_024080640.1 probable ATP-dependent RNA helicase spindle-E [Cimex lectularius]